VEAIIATAYYEDFAAAKVVENRGHGGKAFGLYDQGTLAPDLA
jgi:hypothetical protein